MRKLTFEGFLKQYVTELSGVQTASIHKLANCLHENPRLKEPLYLYALVFDKVNLLLRYAKDPVCLAEYERLSNRYSREQVLAEPVGRAVGGLSESLAQLLLRPGCCSCRQ